jgi:hypothetical protein
MMFIPNRKHTYRPPRTVTGNIYLTLPYFALLYFFTQIGVSPCMGKWRIERPKRRTKQTEYTHVRTHARTHTSRLWFGYTIPTLDLGCTVGSLHCAATRIGDITFIFILFIHGSRVEPGPLLLRPLIGLLYQPRTICGDDCGAVGWMND